MATQLDTIATETIKRLVRTVSSRYTESADYQRAKSILTGMGLYDDTLRYTAAQARFERWRRQCNAVVSQRERYYSNQWLQLKTHNETDEKLANWIIGKSIGSIQNGMLVVVLRGVSIPTMPKEYAEVATFYSLDGKFTLACNDDMSAMAIDAFTWLL